MMTIKQASSNTLENHFVDNFLASVPEKTIKESESIKRYLIYKVQESIVVMD